ncbi:unnamed protein product [Arctogadus glacialis]
MLVEENRPELAALDHRPVAENTPPTPSTGERLFVFRAPPESYDGRGFSQKKKKRNFLNLKKGSVAPTVHTLRQICHHMSVTDNV